MSEEYIQVPLVVYIDGERHVVGDATIKGTEIHAVMDNQKSEAFMGWLFKESTKGEFSLSFGMGEAEIIDRNEKILGPIEVPRVKIPPRVYDPGNYVGLRGLNPKGVYLDEASGFHADRASDREAE